MGMGDRETIKLTPDELWQGVVVGANRRISCLFVKKDTSHYKEYKEGEEWSAEIESCCSEIAVAKWLGVYWSGGVYDKHTPESDVGSGREVRHTTYPTGRLIIYPTDKANHKYLLVTGKAPTYTFIGWMFAGDVQSVGHDHDWWTQPHSKRIPSWWVPQERLRSIQSYKETLTDEQPVVKKSNPVKGGGKEVYDKFRNEQKGGVSEPVDF